MKMNLKKKNLPSKFGMSKFTKNINKANVNTEECVTPGLVPAHNSDHKPKDLEINPKNIKRYARASCFS